MNAVCPEQRMNLSQKLEPRGAASSMEQVNIFSLPDCTFPVTVLCASVTKNLSLSMPALSFHRITSIISFCLLILKRSLCLLSSSHRSCDWYMAYSLGNGDWKVLLLWWIKWWWWWWAQQWTQYLKVEAECSAFLSISTCGLCQFEPHIREIIAFIPCKMNNNWKLHLLSH